MLLGSSFLISHFFYYSGSILLDIWSPNALCLSISSSGILYVFPYTFLRSSFSRFASRHYNRKLEVSITVKLDCALESCRYVEGWVGSVQLYPSFAFYAKFKGLWDAKTFLFIHQTKASNRTTAVWNYWPLLYRWHFQKAAPWRLSIVLSNLCWHSKISNEESTQKALTPATASRTAISKVVWFSQYYKLSRFFANARELISGTTKTYSETSTFPGRPARRAPSLKDIR